MNVLKAFELNRENVLMVVNDLLDQEIAKTLMTRVELDEADEVSIHVRQVQDKTINRLKEMQKYLEANLR